MYINKIVFRELGCEHETILKNFNAEDVDSLISNLFRDEVRFFALKKTTAEQDIVLELIVESGKWVITKFVDYDEAASFIGQPGTKGNIVVNGDLWSKSSVCVNASLVKNIVLTFSLSGELYCQEQWHEL